ncbi:uncharacterized protein LOC131878004 [Tigriopus californicus]|uniref:uncharacterized protein LOC131878004 n=1 Tax=Tigriopus californicus TaxID=6832 RepID=UPI0027D9FCB1|nr:uncharacterized protein LOC131878004 [Tigriopus californicus]
MATCEALGGQLASLESQEEFMFARTIAFTLSFHQPDEFSGDYRIGLYGNGSQWTWSNGNIMDSNLINLWCPNEPRSTDSLSYVQFWGGAGFCRDDIQANTKPQNLICEASVCTMDPPTLNNAKRGIRLMGLLSHTVPDYSCPPRTSAISFPPSPLPQLSWRVDSDLTAPLTSATCPPVPDPDPRARFCTCQE